MILSCQKNSVSITGTILKNIEEEKITLTRGGRIVKEITLDKDKKFNIELETLDKGYYGLYGKLLYLAPGFDLNINIEEDDVTFSGNGSDENKLLSSMLIEERKYAPNSVSTQENRGLDVKGFKAYLDKFTQWANKQFENNLNLDSDFLQTEKKRARLLVSTTLLQHTFKIPKDKLSDAERKKIDSDAFVEFDWNDEALYTGNSVGYRNLLEGQVQRGAYSTVDFTKPGVGQHSISIALRDLVLDSIQNPIIKSDLLASATDAIIKIAPQFADEAFKVFVENNPTKKQKEFITDSYNKMVRLRKGSPSPKFFDYQKVNGDLVSLDDLKGKYVYVDIWATWCIPCKKEIPFLKELEKEYHDKNIHFVSISVDVERARKTWKEMVSDMELTGIQIIANKSFKSDFIAAYNIAGIPRFIIIDPEGNIVEANAPKPSKKELKDIFNSLNI